MEIIAAIPAFSVILHTADWAFPPTAETIKTGQDEESENYGPPQNVQRGLGQGIRCGWNTALPMLREGQVFYADYAKPDGFCDEAWKAIYQYVFALAHGATKEPFYYSDWISKPGMAICSCNDGLRPVIFKLEATDKESQIDYIPVQDQ